MRRLGRTGQLCRSGKILPRHRQAKLPAQAEERSIPTPSQDTIRRLGLGLAFSQASGFGGQQQSLRSIPQQAASAGSLAPRGTAIACGQRHQRPSDRGVALHPMPPVPPRLPAARQSQAAPPAAAPRCKA